MFCFVSIFFPGCITFVLALIFSTHLSSKLHLVIILEPGSLIFFQSQNFVVSDKNMVAFRLVAYRPSKVSFNMMNVTRLSTIGLLITIKIRPHMC